MTTLEDFSFFFCQNTISCRGKLRNLQLHVKIFCREALSLVKSDVTRSDRVNYHGLQDESSDLGCSYPILHAILAEKVHNVDDYNTVVHGYDKDAVPFC